LAFGKREVSCLYWEDKRKAYWGKRLKEAGGEVISKSEGKRLTGSVSNQCLSENQIYVKEGRKKIKTEGRGRKD